MSSKAKKTSVKNAFNAVVIYQLHSNPPIFGLSSDELGYAEVQLADLKLTQAEVDALCAATRVVGTYEVRSEAVDFYHPREGLKQSTWKVTSLKPGV